MPGDTPLPNPPDTICWTLFTCNGRALDRVTKQKHRPNRQKLPQKCLKIVFSASLDNFRTFFGHFFDIFRTFCRHFHFLCCPLQLFTYAWIHVHKANKCQLFCEPGSFERGWCRWRGVNFPCLQLGVSPSCEEKESTPRPSRVKFA